MMLWVGISVHGIMVVDRLREPQQVIHRHPWLALQKVSFNKRRFGILPKTDVKSHRPFKLKYYLESYKK